MYTQTGEIIFLFSQKVQKYVANILLGSGIQVFFPVTNEAFLTQIRNQKKEQHTEILTCHSFQP